LRRPVGVVKVIPVRPFTSAPPLPVVGGGGAVLNIVGLLDVEFASPRIG
jgi:hypothetical protein